MRLGSCVAKRASPCSFRAPYRVISTSDGSRDAAETVADVRYALDHDMLMPIPDVVAISSILASHGFYKTALESLRLCNPYDIHQPAHVKHIISNVILRYFGSSSTSTDKSFQHVSISLDLITMLKLKHDVKVSVEVINDIYFHFLQTKQKHRTSAKAMIVAGTLYPQFIQCYRFCDIPHPLHDCKLGVMDVTGVPNSLVSAVVVEGIKQYKSSLVSAYYSHSCVAPHSTVFDERDLDNFLQEHCTPITIITDRGRGLKAKAKFDALVTDLEEELQIKHVSELFLSNLRALVAARSDIRRPLDRYGRSVASVLTLAEYESLMCEYIYGNQEVGSRSAMVAVVSTEEVKSLVRRSVARHYWRTSVAPPSSSAGGELTDVSPSLHLSYSASSSAGNDTNSDKGDFASSTKVPLLALRSNSHIVDSVDLSIINDITSVIGASPVTAAADVDGVGEQVERDARASGDDTQTAAFWENKMQFVRQSQENYKEARFVLRLVQEMKQSLNKKK